MQDSGLAGLSGRPLAHRAMSSSAAFSPYASNRRQHFDGQINIGNPSSITEDVYSNPIGSARLDGQVIPPQPYGSTVGNEYERAAQDRFRDTGRGRLNRTQTLSGSASFELPAPSETSPAGNRIRSRFESFTASSDANGNSTSPFAGNGFGGTLSNSAGRGSFGLTGSVSATGSTFGNTGYPNLGMGYPASGRDREVDRPYDGAPTGFSGGFLHVPNPGTGTRSNSFSGGEWRSPRGMMSVMPSVPSSTAINHYADAPQHSLARQGSYRLAENSSQFAETFSDTSSPPSSPRMGSRVPQNGNGRDSSARLPARAHSPPRASAFVSRSRSQSLAISGLRPTLGSGLIPMPMSTVSGQQDCRLNAPNTQSGNNPRRDVDHGPTSPWAASASPFGRDAFGAASGQAIQDESIAPVGGSDAWGRQRQAERERDRHAHADLANSIQAALGDLHDEHSRDQQPGAEAGEAYNGYPSANERHDSNGQPNGHNIRSGASSRRHSVSVVGGPSARTRGFGLPGFGFSDVNSTNVVHRYGPVHQAERESIYPQPFGGSNGRFRAGDEPHIATLGSRNLGGYADEDLLAGGFSNRLHLGQNGNQQATSSMLNAGAVPIGRRASAMAPPSALDGQSQTNIRRDQADSPSHSYNYGTSPAGISGIASREVFGRTPSQTSASPQYSSIDNHMSTRGQASGSSRARPSTADRFQNALTVGSPISELPSSVNGSAVPGHGARDSGNTNSLAPGGHVSSSALGIQVAPGSRVQNGSFLAGPGHMPNTVPTGVPGAGYGYFSPAPPGPAFVSQRAPGPAPGTNSGFQPIGHPQGNMGISVQRTQGQGQFVAVNGMPMLGMRPSPGHAVAGSAGPPYPAIYRQPQALLNPYAGLAGPVPDGNRPLANGNNRNVVANGNNAANGNNIAANAPMQNSVAELGRGLPLASIAAGTKLYIVEFTAKRTDVFYAENPDQDFHEGEVVIVEADRGKDLGTVINDTVTLEEVRAFAAARRQTTAPVPGRQAPVQIQVPGEGGLLQSQLRGVDVGHADPAETAAVQGLNKEIMPKRIFRVATPADLQHMPAKRQDEERAIAVCRSKVAQHGLQMSVVAAEYQWDRKKLTFYFTARRRVDFRDLVKELFRIHKTRIWMACLGGSYLLTDESDRPTDMPQYRVQQ